MELMHHDTNEAKLRQIKQAAEARFNSDADWNTFFREILGVDGIIERLYPTPEERDVFEETETFNEIQIMLAKLRARRGGAKEEEPTRVITVRLPQSLHESLRNEAHVHKTSMNKLCISKLLQVIDDELVPSDLQKREPPKQREMPVQTLPISTPTAPGNGQPVPSHQPAAPAAIGPAKPVQSPAATQPVPTQTVPDKPVHANPHSPMQTPRPQHQPPTHFTPRPSIPAPSHSQNRSF